MPEQSELPGSATRVTGGAEWRDLDKTVDTVWVPVPAPFRWEKPTQGPRQNGLALGAKMTGIECGCLLQRSGLLTFYMNGQTILRIGYWQKPPLKNRMTDLALPEAAE